MVRLDPTKSAMRFVDLVETLVATQRRSASGDGNGGGAAASTLVSVPGHPSLRVVPFLCGAAADAEYAAAVRSRLREVCPFAVIEERFMTPVQMAPVLLRAAVNAHPCLYDAYAMTIVEAAAFGVPSIVHGDPLTGSSDVGAAATLMRSSEGEVVLVDWAFGGPAPAPPALVSATAALLKAQAAVAARRCGFAPALSDASDTNAEAAERMSAACRERALSYTEEDVAAQLLTLVQ
jgi:glycosyltransferase involved in cell wall biosynthesis